MATKSKRKNPELEKAMKGLREPTVFFANYVYPSQVLALKNIIAEQGRGTVSALIRDIIDDYLRNRK